MHPTLTLVGGVRYDSYYDRISDWSPRGAAVWHPFAPTTLKLLYGQAFRPPNLFEQYYAYPAPGVDNLPNPQLDPEQITTFPLPWHVEGGAELLIVGPRETRDGGTVSTATIANLTLGRRDLLGSWLPGLDGRASFYNIFDQHYTDPAPGEIEQDAIEQDGFTFRLQLRYAFQP